MTSRSVIHFSNLFFICQTISSSVGAFQLPHSTSCLPKQHIATTLPQRYYYTYSPETKLFVSTEESHDQDLPIERSVTSSCWNPTIRKTFTVLSSIGMVETGYLSYLKLFDPAGINKICGGDGVTSTMSSCSSVLNSPYASIQLNEENAIPLTLLGFVAYTTVAALSAYPMLLSSQTVKEKEGVELDVNNRIAILCTTTTMATFSSFLLSLLFNTLHQSCPYCILSAGLSLTMGFTAWFTGMLPTNNRENGVKLALGSFATTIIASLILFVGIDEAALTAYQNDVLASNGLSNNVVATAEEPQKNIPPPPITSKSSEQALKIGQDLKGLNTRFFGAYWCSHCYEQKQRLGKEAMANVQYIECSKEGLNSQNDLCKERGIPGYPTWEIGGNLYPGEMYLDELEEIIAKEKQKI